MTVAGCAASASGMASAPQFDSRFGLNRSFTLAQPLMLDGGASLGAVSVAYETYGVLNPDGSNAVLICHALTGDQHVASPHPITGKPGWWWRLVVAIVRTWPYANFERPFTPQNQLRTVRNFGKHRFKRFPTNYFSAGKKKISENF